ncbi:Reverse transcriptase (RNA-dependent DNA polymerase) [Variovorax sp. YR634]|uniref:RNA-directed DNA polymerase n=1 Tax=Variovorax sp. YR634 TaxID=1884385 RepID=UPI0008943585|nr:Reverse transcriptase (RNA-dependent DNA polymerase) [Variovorax sp. YR634]
MTVKAPMPVRNLNLVAPLPHEGTAMRITDTAASVQAWSGAVSPLIGFDLRQGDVDSTNQRRLPATTPGIRTSTTATRTTTTRSSKAAPASFADSYPFSFEELVQAYLDCRKSKRNTASALAFESQLERNLCALYEELTSGAWRPGRSICFVITRPKPREVWAADFRDRIVHHLLYNRIARRFHASFVHSSSACIPGRGTLYAAMLLERDVRSVTQNWSRPAFYLKCDLANFFVAIDKVTLRDQLARKVHEPFWLALAETILFHDPREDHELRGRAELLARVPAHKSLFNAPAHTGLPIGNLSSQFFANVHLDALDQFAKHQLRATRYVRYVDDFILLHESSQWLRQAHDRIAAFLPERLGARLNPSKTILQPVDRGIDFVGHVIKPWRRTTRPRTVATALHRIETLPAADLFATGNSYLGLMRQAGNSHQDQVAVGRALLKRGHAIDGGLTKIFRKKPLPLTA